MTIYFNTKMIINMIKKCSYAVYYIICRSKRDLHDLIGSVSIIYFKKCKIKTISCQKSDLQNVIKIYQENFGGGAERTIKIYQIFFKKTFYVLKGGTDNLLGYCIYYIHINFNRWRFVKVATIYSFAVDDAYKNQGIGGNLLKESINELTENNVWNILLFVNINNHSALHLYEKYGFKVIGEVENRTCSI